MACGFIKADYTDAAPIIQSQYGLFFRFVNILLILSFSKNMQFQLQLRPIRNVQVNRCPNLIDWYRKICISIKFFIAFVGSLIQKHQPFDLA